MLTFLIIFFAETTYSIIDKDKNIYITYLRMKNMTKDIFYDVES